MGHTLGVVELTDTSGLIDTYGSESFRLLHQNFLARIREWIRATDQLKTLNGSRCCVILRGVTNRAEIELAIAKLKRLFTPSFDLLGVAVKLEVKVGFVMFSESQPDLKRLVREAGIALRSAKQAHTLFEIFDNYSQVNYVDESRLVKRLEEGVERGEFELYCQPKIHAGYRNVVGAEALIRWHWKGRVIAPGEFIEVAERHDVIRPMTWWIIKSALALLARWPEPMVIAVNVPPSLLLDDELILVVKDAVDIFGVPPRRLILEVTETVMVENPEQMLPRLNELRELGVRVSIDDFGTGFSSMLYFRDLPADELKIDRSFVTPMCSSTKDYAIVKSIIDLAHNFGMKVVAEGVEDEQTAKRLAEINCDTLQGYWIDKPLPIETFEKRYLL